MKAAGNYWWLSVFSYWRQTTNVERAVLFSHELVDEKTLSFGD